MHSIVLSLIAFTCEPSRSESLRDSCVFSCQRCKIEFLRRVSSRVTSFFHDDGSAPEESITSRVFFASSSASTMPPILVYPAPPDVVLDPKPVSRISKKTQTAAYARVDVKVRVAAGTQSAAKRARTQMQMRVSCVCAKFQRRRPPV